MNEDPDRYLWSRDGDPDPELAALESELAPQRWSGRLPAGPLPARPAAPSRRLLVGPRVRWPLTVAAAVLAAGVLGLLWSNAHQRAAPGPGDPGGATDGSSGAPAGATGEVYHALALCGALDSTELRLGDWLVTDRATRARLEVGDIGSLIVEPDSSLRVDRPEPGLAADAEHVLWLERGTITASIFAAPRLFQLGTPSGLAVDLGCIYTAHVLDDGTTRLSVLAGRVAFETPERRVTVPARASTIARPFTGPGTPLWDDAPPALAEAVARLDAEVLADAGPGAADAGLPDAVGAVLSGLRERDTLTLWHLLAWQAVPAAERSRMLERLAALSPPPAGVTAPACLALDQAALDCWQSKLEVAW